MQAIICDRYGPPEVLRLATVNDPVPGARAIRIRVQATTVTSADCRVRACRVPAGFGLIMRLALGLRKPRQPILGMELAGVVDAVGREVKRFRAGDAVFALADADMGAYAEFKCLPEDAAVARLPAGFGSAEAAALSFGGTTALEFLRKAKLQTGEKILIIGAAGGVGTAAVQLAKHFGAVVTGVCGPANLDLVKSLGADSVIDYTREDFAARPEKYDVIMDVVGTTRYPRCRAVLKEHGRLLLVTAGLTDTLMTLWAGRIRGHRVVAGPAFGRAEDMRFLAALAEKGAFRAVIDRTYPFAQIVEAHRYVDTGRKRGNVIILL